MTYHHCNYIEEHTTDYDSMDAAYIDYWWISDAVKPPLQEALKVDPKEMAEAKFHNVSDYADAWTCIDYEGLP